MTLRTKDTVDFIKEIVAQMTPTILIDAIRDNGDGTFSLNSFNTYWIRPDRKLIIDGKLYRVESFIINDVFTICEVTEGAGVPTVDSFQLPAPHFFHGVTEQSANEQAAKKNPDDRTPFIWLYEILTEKPIKDKESNFGRQSTPNLFFMDEARFKDWTSAQHKTNVIEPMRQMVELFFNTIDGQREFFAEILEHDETARANWGKFIADAGHSKRFFKEDLSGHQVNFDFLMTKKACDKRQTLTTCTIGGTITTTTPTSAGGSDGTATANPTGNQGNLTFKWFDAGMIAIGQATQVATGLTAGVYFCEVTDEIINNCIATLSGEVLDAAFIFKSTKSSAGSFSMTYTGTGTPIWTDITNGNTETGTSATFTAGWIDSTEKTVTVLVEQVDKITNLTSFSADKLTHLDISLLSKLVGTTDISVNIYSDNLTLPLSNTSTIFSLEFDSSQVVGVVDASGLTGGFTAMNVSSNPLMTGLILPAHNVTMAFTCDLSNCALGVLNWADMPNMFGGSGFTVSLQNNTGLSGSAAVNETLVIFDSFAPVTANSHGINIAGTNGVVDATSGGFDGLAAETSLISKGYVLTTN